MTDFAKYRATLTPEVAVELRHDLRTPVNHIVGYAEMLLEDVPDAETGRRSALQGVLGAAREVLDLINRSVGSGGTIDAGTVETLYAALRVKQEAIVTSVESLTASAGAWSGGSAVEDLGRILQAARRLAPASHAVSRAPEA